MSSGKVGVTEMADGYPEMAQEASLAHFREFLHSVDDRCLALCRQRVGSAAALVANLLRQIPPRGRGWLFIKSFSSLPFPSSCKMWGLVSKGWEEPGLRFEVPPGGLEGIVVELCPAE